MNKILNVLKTIVRILSIILPLIPNNPDSNNPTPKQPTKPQEGASDETFSNR